MFGVTAGLLTLHYANLGPAWALHVVWNVAVGLGNVNEWDADFAAALSSFFGYVWTWDDIRNGALFKFVAAPLLIETLFVFAACRDTIGRLFSAPGLARA